MIINGFVFKNPLKTRGFLAFGLLLLFFFVTPSSYGQSAEAEANFAVCKACHNIDGPKLIGPNLKGITERREEAWLIKFIQNSQAMIEAGDPIAVQVFEENNRIPMPPNPQLNEEQIKDLLLYIEKGGKVEGAIAEPEAVTEPETQSVYDAQEELLVEMKRDDARHLQATFIAMIVLIVLALFDLFVTKIVKQRWIHTVIIIISVVVAGEVLFVEATNLGRQQYYQPEQPVWFSHKIHAGQNQIDCQYCHFTADKSMHAGIPPVQVCLNCHNQVKTGKITGEEEIAKIHDAYNYKKPIEWIKVHNLPDHVYFNHAQHVTIGKVDCNDCHGEVEKMDEIIQVHDLSMGWCIDCHRTREIQISNKFYDKFTDLHAQIKNGEIKRATVVSVGGEECQRCHY
jgi:cytochrome c551/c552